MIQVGFILVISANLKTWTTIFIHTQAFITVFITCFITGGVSSFLLSLQFGDSKAPKMEELLSKYHDIIANDSTISPFNIISQLGALNSQEIIVLLNDAQESGRMIEDIGMSGDSLQQTPLYSTRIIINKRNAFVASDISSPTASDEAANLFISFLKTNNKGPEGPKLENEDEPYTKKVFKNLRSFGYMINCENVPCVNPQFHVDYHFNFAIPGFGDFYSDACTESSDALKIATSRLKQFYDQQFSSLSQQFANSKLKHHQFTFPVDFKWVGLLNSFSHVYCEFFDSNYGGIIQRLTEYGHLTYTKRDEFVLVKEKYKRHYKTSIYFANVTFSSVEINQEKAYNRASFKAVCFLRKLVKLFAAFQKVYSEKKMPTAIYEELLTELCDKPVLCGEFRENRVNDSVTFTLHLANIRSSSGSLNNIIATFHSTAKMLFDAKYDACLMLVQYLKTLSDDIHLSQLDGNKNHQLILRSPSSDPSSCPNLSLASNSFKPLFINNSSFNEPEVASLGHSHFHNSIIQLINQFNSVYVLNKSPVAIIEEIMNTGSVEFDEDTKWHHMEGKFITNLKSQNLGNFSGKDRQEGKSRMKAFSQAYTFIRQISVLFTTFQAVFQSNEYSTYNVETFLALNSEIVSVKMKQLELDSFECSVSIPSLHFYFIATESNKEASQNRAFHYMIDYLKQLAKNIKGTIPINKPLYKYEPQGCSMNTHGIRLPTPPASEKSRRASTSSVASSKKSGSAGLFVIEHVLRLDFICAQYPTLNDVDSMLKLSEYYESNGIKAFDVQKPKCVLKNEGKSYQTLIKAHLFGSFTGVSSEKNDSQVKAWKDIYRKLRGLSEVITAITSPTFDISPLNIEVFCIKNSDFVKIISEKNRKLSRSSLIANENGLCIMVKLVFITESDRSKHYDRATAFRQVISNVSMMREKVLQKIHNDAGLCNGAMSSSRPSSDVFSSVDSQLNDGSEVCTTRVQLLKLIQSIYPPNGKIITMLDYLIASRPDLITAQTKQTRDQIHCISTISFATFGDFYACDQFANKSTIACARKAFEYFKSLFFLLIQLKLHFTEKKSLELFQQLPRTIVKEYSLVSSSPSGPMYIHAISLERMCAFSQADSSCDAARTGAVLQLIEYLSQFLQAIDI